MPAHELIRKRRERLGLSQEELIAKLRPVWPELTKSMLSKIENGHRIVKADEIPLFAAALKIRKGDLLDPKPW